MQYMTNSKIEVIQTWMEEIIFQIDCAKRVLKNEELLQICGGIEKIIQGEFNPHYCHEIAETALNLLILAKYAKNLTENSVEFMRQNLKPLVSRLPTQTWRSREQISFQQFSTPPAIGYLLIHTLNIKPSEIVLEPSAGTGSLAVWAKASGAKVLTNEIDARRRELLQQLGFKPTDFNAEFIHDFLAPEITVDVLLMNPPFSANGGRTKNSSKYGFRHVESALERLNKGGRFGIILGKAGGLDTKTGREFWQKMVGHFSIKANLKLSGREYYKNGTTVDINLIFGEKLFEPRQVDQTKAVNQIPFITAQTVEEAFGKLATNNIRFNQ
jgi:predicted RNA methylase